MCRRNGIIMTTLISTTGTPRAFLPEEVGELVVKPTQALSIATQVATTVQTGAHSYRVPIVNTDPTAAWTAEGAEIEVSNADVAELEITFSKLAGLSIISNELANDSSPAAAQLIGEGIARDIATKVDAAFFGPTAAGAPAGLESLSGIGTVHAGTAWANTDPFAEAQANAEQIGAPITSFVANPADALALAKVKKMTGSNEPLLAVDNTQASRRTVVGVPLLVSPAVVAGTIWGIPKTRALIVIREGTTLDVDPSPYFSSDRLAVRVVMRIGFGFTDTRAAQKITLTV